MKSVVFPQNERISGRGFDAQVTAGVPVSLPDDIADLYVADGLAVASSAGVAVSSGGGAPAPAAGGGSAGNTSLTAAQLAAIANEPADAAAIAALQAKLAAGGAPTPAATVRGTYSASGPIAITDDVSEVSSATPVTMTLASDTVDNRLHVISQAGPGAVTLTTVVDGVSQSVSLNAIGSLRDSLTLRWLAAPTTYKAE